MKLAVALWNDLDPTQITHLKGRWYHMYSGRHAPLRDPSNHFIEAAVKANKGRKNHGLTNPWPKKQEEKELQLIQLQKQREKTITVNQAKAMNKTKKEQMKTTTGSSVLKPAKERKYNLTSLPTVPKTTFAANQQWLNKAEKVVKMASPNNSKNKKEKPIPIENHDPPASQQSYTTPEDSYWRDKPKRHIQLKEPL